MTARILPRPGEVALPFPRMRVRWYGIAVGAVLAALTVLAVAVELSVGEYPIPLGKSFEILVGGR